IQKYYKGETIYERVHNVPFSSERKWSAISFKDIGSIIVGAPERLFEKSTKAMPENIKDLQKQGKRVLAIAYTNEVIDKPELPEIQVVAIMILEDPLRKNAKEMLGYF